MVQKVDYYDGYTRALMVTEERLSDLKLHFTTVTVFSVYRSTWVADAQTVDAFASIQASTWTDVLV